MYNFGFTSNIIDARNYSIFFAFQDAVLTPCGKEKENGYTPHNIRIVAISQAVGRTLLTFFHKIERGGLFTCVIFEEA